MATVLKSGTISLVYLVQVMQEDTGTILLSMGVVTKDQVLMSVWILMEVPMEVRGKVPAISVLKGLMLAMTTDLAMMELVAETA